MSYTIKELLNEIHYKTWSPAKAITRQIDANRKGSSAKSEDSDIEYHKEQIGQLKDAIATNPQWAASMLPNMKKRLEQHQKRYLELTQEK